LITIGIIHIDETATLLESAPDDVIKAQQVENEKKKFQQVANTYGVEFYFIPLEQVFDIKDAESSLFSPSTNTEQETNLQKLKSLLQSIKTLTPKEDLIEKLRWRLIAHTTLKNGFKKIMRGDSGDRVAMRIMSSTTKGGGFMLPSEVAFYDERFGISIAQPLKDSLLKEVSFYNRVNKIEEIFIPSISTMVDSKKSINLLTEAFLNGLQVDFPSTFHAILGIGEKLKTPTGDNNDMDAENEVSLSNNKKKI